MVTIGGLFIGDGTFGDGTMGGDILTSPKGHRLLDYLPLYYHESIITKAYLQMIGSELDMLFQLMSELRRESFIKYATWTLDKWEEDFGIIKDSSLSDEVRRARVQSYLIKRSRIRRVDIESIVRNYLSGPRAYVLQSYSNSIKIKVSNVDGFTIGNKIYVGSQESILQSVDYENNELIFSTPLSPYPFALVSQSRVIIVEFHSEYRFNIIIQEGFLTDLNELINSVNQSKPAHLGWKLLGSEGTAFESYWDNKFSLGDTSNIRGDVLADLNVLYETTPEELGYS